MSDALPPDIKRIITAQTQRLQPQLPTAVAKPVLPKIGATFAAVASVGPAGGSSSRVDEAMDRMSIRETPIQSGLDVDSFHFNYSFIPDHELLRSAQSTPHADAGGRLMVESLPIPKADFDRTFVIRKDAPLPRSDDSISLLDLKLASIPSRLPDIDGLQTAVDNLSSRRVQSILDACRLYDRELRKHLSVPSMIKCIGEVVISAHAPTSPWRQFLHSLAPEGEFIEYEKLMALVEKSRKPEFAKVTIPELLSPRNMGGEAISFKPSTGQESRERCRTQVITEIEVMLMRNPELTLDRLKTATTQKTIEVAEFKTLLEIYGLEEAFRPFYQRLVSCFLTHDNKIHFSAFIGCLALVRPPLRQSAPAPAPSAPWSKPPLAPIAPPK